MQLMKYVTLKFGVVLLPFILTGCAGINWNRAKESQGFSINDKVGMVSFGCGTIGGDVYPGLGRKFAGKRPRMKDTILSFDRPGREYIT